MAQRQQLYESQKEITNELTGILAKIESTEVRSASIAQYKKHIDILESKFISNDSILKKLGETSEDYFTKEFFQAGIKLFQLCRNAMQKYGQTSAEAVLAPKKAEDLKESLMESMESSLQKSIESVKISIKDDMMQQMGLMMQNLLQQLKPNHGENSLKELKSAPSEPENAPREPESAPREPERAPREPERAPREPENVPREQINIPKEEKEQNHDEAGITKEEEVTSNLLIQFRREIRKLEECLSDTEAENILILEHKKSSWEKIMVDIKQIHRELVVNHSIKEDIDEELELIDKQYGDALKEILLKISAMLEDKKGLVLETIKIPIFYGDMEEWYSFHNMFNRFVHMSKLPAVEKLMRLKTHVRGEALKIIQNLPITDNNYEAAWGILNQRFGNKRILFTKLVDKILDQPSTNIMSASSLRNLLNITNESIQALKAMGVSLEGADPIIARIIIRKLDKEGLILYEQNTRKSKEIQILKDVMQFIELQCEALEASTTKKYNNMEGNKKNPYRATVLSTENSYCNYCRRGGHKIRDCKIFLGLTVENRNSWVRTTKMCNICLNHRMDKRCYGKTKCQVCGRMHNTLLHINFVKSTGTAANNTASSMSTHSPANVLLATAQVKVKSLHGEFIMLRALIDHCSQVTTVSEEASQILALPRIKCRTEIHGLGGVVVGVSKSKIKLSIKPRFLSDQSVETDALILPQLTGAQPDRSFKFNVDEWNNFVLADPSLNKSDRIDIVIGMDIITNIIEDGIFKKDGFLAQYTIFGWILSGIVNKKANPKKVLSAVTNLERFWELEELHSNSEDYEEDKICLDLFNETTEVDNQNRIVVHLPIRKEENELGDSKKQAVARLLSLERKLDSNPKLKEDYNQFLKEYIQLGHMEEVAQTNSGKYYLPHQAVIRESSLTTKLRVVFDASAKTSNGKSLNDVMYTGPRLQKEIFEILVKWRLWKYVVTADVEKMYRQIKVAPKHQKYQHILWREYKNEAIKEYKLTTVTYGTASAPFLAVRALFYIADSCPKEEIKNIIKEDFYMDDLMTGADTISQCRNIQNETLSQLQKYGFNLRKWLANDYKIIDGICDSTNNAVIQIEDDEAVKTLGLQWDPVQDNFKFNINFSVNGGLTKRRALSEVAKIFDPLGWLSPVTIVAKLYVQKLWLLQCTWDEELSAELKEEWQQFTTDLPELQEIRVPRWLQIIKSDKFELHGFADASEKAYAAVVYLKIKKTITLVAAKTKVNPMKNRKTLPKLELCAAHLLAKLLNKVSATINRQHAVYAWSDSTITLAWIANKSNKDKFVRNRVAEIINMVPDARWRHVSSKDNPADVASRGISALKLKAHMIWWNGPEWLKMASEFWPKKEAEPVKVMMTTATNKHSLIIKLTDKFSSFSKLQRVVAFILRFINKLRKKSYATQYLTVKELEEAEELIIRGHQEIELQEEMAELRRSGVVNRSSRIASLFPFIDRKGIIRVGGRLQNSNLPYNQQHPIILRKSHLTFLLIEKEHISTLHGGNRLVESALRRRFWILEMKNSIKKCLRRCPKCIRYSQDQAKQLMGNLPQSRVTISAPFQHVGVDYAGPIQMKFSKGRGQKSYKGYIAVFVCMTTKAIHLEAVSDLTSDAFLAALKRFFGRRGVSSDIYSDNGTNFVGANIKLDKDFKAAVLKNETIIPILAMQKIRWHFIPPAAPHFGGIWEAGVKSVKYHLKRTIGEAKLTYEEMSTLLIQIEAVLNSRPLVALNSDEPDNLDALTPGHFLIGRPLNACPEVVEEANINSLNRWKLIQKLRKDFWVRWKQEYLTTLQQRNKWKFPLDNLKEGTIVLIKDDNTHPANWPLARIAEVHSGKDGKVRVATLKLANSSLKRPISKLCPLVSMDKEEEKSAPVKSCFTKMKPEKKKLCWLQLILMILMIMKPVKALPMNMNNVVSITELPTNTALYLDKVGQLNAINSKWNLVVYYDLSLYYQELERIGKLMGKVREECPKLNVFKDSCEMVMSVMERRYTLINQNNELLINKPRKKRAPFEFVGSIYHVLFGMMDAGDREQMEENMKNIFNNQEDLNKLIKQQTSLIDSTVNVLKKTTEDVNNNFKQMYGQMKLFYDQTKNESSAERLTILFSVLATQLNLMVDECQKIQSSVINMLIDINHGHINTDLLTPSQLRKELQHIENVLPNNLVLPGKTTGTELKEVYHGMKAKGTIIEARLVVQIEIPLIQKHNSEVYEIITLPVDINNSAVMPRVEDEFIIYNFASNMYFLMSQAKLNKCGKSLQGQYNCIGNMPWKPAIERSCEVSALKQSRHAECAFEAVPRKSVWKQLSTENQWIFTVFDNLVLTVDCGPKNRSWVTLPPKGILKLVEGCTATYEGITLSASQHLESAVNSVIQASTWGIDPEKIEAKLVKPFDVTIINNSKDINHLMKEVLNMKETKINLKRLHFHMLSGHTSLILIIIIIFILIGLVIKNKCCTHKEVVKIDFSTPLPLRARQNVQI